jgi:hypothetical protein
MKTVQLSEAEKERMAFWLARRAWVGGWFFVALAGVALLLMYSISAQGAVQKTDSAETWSAFTVVALVLLGPGVWLLWRRRVIRAWLDEPLYAGSGRIVALKQVPYSGYRVRLLLQHDGEEFSAEMGFLGRPKWQIGEELALILWQNGRFCPRAFDFIVDFGYLPTLKRRRFVRRRVIAIALAWLFMTALALILGLYGQGRLF